MRDAHRVLLIALLPLSGACARSAVQSEPSADHDSLAEAVATITAEDMRARITYLASDELAGRDTPSPGLEMAAEYLAAQFQSSGLEPGGDEGSFFQRYSLPLRALDTESVHFGTVDADGSDNQMLEYGVDFFASPAIDREGRDMRHGSLIYFGELPEGGLPTSADVQGKVMVASLPGAPDRDLRLRAASARRQAEEAGASALFLLLGPGFPAEMVGRMAELSAEPRRVLVNPDEVPVFYISNAAAAAILGQGGFDRAAPGDLLASGVSLTAVEAHFAAVPLTLEDSRPPNVAAIIRGSDPELRDEYVVFSAHMDHVGVGTADATGDSIYNGADDDASGTAALVEVAEAFAALEEPPARSLLFLVVSGEEKGLLGSRYFSDHPTIPLESIVANINVDMIARNAPDSVVVIGQEYSSLGPLVRTVASQNAVLGLTVVPDPWPEERFFFRSDHFNFARKEIPALFFFAGVHEDYHRPSDEVDKIDADKAARVARLIFYTAHAIADDASAPEWTEVGLTEIRALTR
jgi:Zn-dependent M28 family amino/carboxypeptidase